MQEDNPSSSRTAVVAGASGFLGRRLVEQLHAEGWRVLILSRRVPAASALPWIKVDLDSAEDCTARLQPLSDLTHVFYAARHHHEEGKPESVEANTAMLRNLVVAIEKVGHLQHVHAVHGSRYYGHRTLDIPMPMREVHPRGGEDNFYFSQEDFLREASAGKRWHYSTSRPHVFCDSAADQPRSVILAIGMYAAIQKALGEPLHFPGHAAGFRVLGQFTDVMYLARAISWMARSPQCAGRSLNVVNGDVLSWADLWPQLAEHFHMQAAEPRQTNLARFMADKDALWDAIVEKHGLQRTRLHEVADWTHADALFRRTRDIYSSMDLATSLGFTERVDSIAMFRRHLSNLSTQKILPPFASG